MAMWTLFSCCRRSTAVDDDISGERRPLLGGQNELTLPSGATAGPSGIDQRANRLNAVLDRVSANMIYVHRFQSERDSHGTSTSSSPVRGRQPYRPRPSSPRAQTPIQTPSPAPPASEADSMSLPPERQLPPPRLQVISIQRRPHLRPRAPGQSSLRRPVLPTPSHSDYDVSASTLLAGAESVDATRPESQAASPLRAQGSPEIGEEGAGSPAPAGARHASAPSSSQQQHQQQQLQNGATQRRSVLQVTDWDGL